MQCKHCKLPYTLTKPVVTDIRQANELPFVCPVCGKAFVNFNFLMNNKSTVDSLPLINLGPNRGVKTNSTCISKETKIVSVVRPLKNVGSLSSGRLSRLVDTYWLQNV